ncbi:Sugar transporter [Venturia inaequalis]|nr:Sugar transporter [Venturia inaequalis]
MARVMVQTPNISGSILPFKNAPVFHGEPGKSATTKDSTSAQISSRGSRVFVMAAYKAENTLSAESGVPDFFHRTRKRHRQQRSTECKQRITTTATASLI